MIGPAILGTYVFSPFRLLSNVSVMDFNNYLNAIITDDQNYKNKTQVVINWNYTVNLVTEENKMVTFD